MATDTAIINELKQLNKQVAELTKANKKHSAQSVSSLAKMAGFTDWVEYVVGFSCTVIAIALNLATNTSATGGINYPDFEQPLKTGDVIAGYQITSEFGMRTHPIHGIEKMHEGVDVATPSGTKLYMIGDVGTVECKEDPTGYGTYAIIKPDRGGADYEFLAGHLDLCQSGTFEGGQIFARTGNTGSSTGAHLHWEQHKNGEAIAPQKGWLQWLLTGEKPIMSTSDAAITGVDGVTQELMSAIASQESGGNCSATNHSGSGASGCYQIMPENLPQWSKDALGHEVSWDEFMANPSLQHRIAAHKLNEYWESAIALTQDKNEACRRVAAQWYSGNPDSFTSTIPQYWNGNQYPSIAEYSSKVCEGFENG